MGSIQDMEWAVHCMVGTTSHFISVHRALKITMVGCNSSYTISGCLSNAMLKDGYGMAEEAI